MKDIVIDESWYRRLPGLPEFVSAGGIVVRQENKRAYIALVSSKRQKEYILPKGHVDPGETIEEAARREIEEEAGLSELSLVADLGYRERLDFAKVCWKKTHYFLFTTTQIQGNPTDPYTAYQLHWVPLDELAPLFWPEQKELIESNREQILRSLDLL